MVEEIFQYTKLYRLSSFFFFRLSYIRNCLTFHLQAHYVLLLCTFKEQLQQHVKVHAMEAVMACWELEQSLLTLTGENNNREFRARIVFSLC